MWAARLSGLSTDENIALAGQTEGLSFTALLTCSLVIAGLGVLNDTTITQSSAVWELRAAGPHLSRWELFSSGMRIGRDHIASTIYTIVFAYAGAALSTLVLLALYEQPLGLLLSTEQFAEEIVRTLGSGIGLVLSVPLTTAVAASLTVLVAFMPPLIGLLINHPERAQQRAGAVLKWVVPPGYTSHYLGTAWAPFPVPPNFRGRVPDRRPPEIDYPLQRRESALTLAYAAVYFVGACALFSRRDVKIG